LDERDGAVASTVFTTSVAERETKPPSDGEKDAEITCGKKPITVDGRGY
jgi:hypothetical protein